MDRTSATYEEGGKEHFQNNDSLGDKLGIINEKLDILLGRDGGNAKLNENNRENLAEHREINELKHDIYKKEAEIKLLKKQVSELEEAFKEIKKRAIIAKKEKVLVQEDLMKSYEKEEKLLLYYQKLSRRYKALSESKLGRITLAYWRKRRRTGGK